MGPILCPETPVTNNQSALRNIPEEQRFNLHRDGNLKSHIVYIGFMLAIKKDYVQGIWSFHGYEPGVCYTLKCASVFFLILYLLECHLLTYQ